jgi:hypothetical protein
VAAGAALDAVDAGANLPGNRQWVDCALGALLPTPQVRPADPDFDGTLRRARADWLAPTALDGLIDPWIALAVGEPDAADAVASFARTAPHDWQATEGLTWLERIIDNRYDRFAGRCWFVVSWLAELRDRFDDVAVPARWHRDVDGLAGAGDRRAVDLQRRDE